MSVFLCRGRVVLMGGGIYDRICLMENGVKIILASASPRRKQILSWITPDYEARPADIDETPRHGEDPIAYTRRMALGKMAKAAEALTGDVLVIGSDTTVSLDGVIFGKPRDAAHAREMLSLLNGKEHIVATAVSMFTQRGGTVRTLACVDVTHVRFRHMSEAEVDGFVAGGVPMGKAGAYAIQDREYHPVESIRGCYTGVMGFPFCAVLEMMRNLGFSCAGIGREMCERGSGQCCSFVPSYSIETIP